MLSPLMWPVQVITLEFQLQGLRNPCIQTTCHSFCKVTAICCTLNCTSLATLTWKLQNHSLCRNNSFECLYSCSCKMGKKFSLGEQQVAHCVDSSLQRLPRWFGHLLFIRYAHFRNFFPVFKASANSCFVHTYLTVSVSFLFCA